MRKILVKLLIKKIRIGRSKSSRSARLSKDKRLSKSHSPTISRTIIIGNRLTIGMKSARDKKLKHLSRYGCKN
jgi:hypothetical protein